MAVTAFGALTALQKTLFGESVTRSGRDENFWFRNGFVGKSSSDMNKPVHLITEVTETTRGSQAIMPFVRDLDIGGVPGDNILTGNEDEIVADSLQVNYDQLRKGVRRKGRMDEQKTVLRFRREARNVLVFWWAETVDELLFLTASGVSYSNTTTSADGSDRRLDELAFAADVTAASTNRAKYAGSATSTADITSTDTITWDGIVNTCAFMKRKRLRPIREGGKSYYCVVLSTEQARDLKKDSDYQTINKDGNLRGSAKNPLFTGALSVVDGVILHEHNKVFSTLDAASGSKWGASGTEDGARAIFFGAQALAFARIGSSYWDEADDTDYKNRPGFATGGKIGMRKSVYQSRYDDDGDEDFGTVILDSAAAA